METMMIPPNCPDHQRLVLDLALGRLDDEAAIAAESIGESCPVCRAWWQEQFDGGAAEVVDDAVAAGFTDLKLPRRRSNRGWMAAAAAVVMALGVGTIWVSQKHAPMDETMALRTASIQKLDFESFNEADEFAMIEVPDPDPAPVARTLAQRSIVEETTVDVASPVEVASADSSKTLFVGSFESGDLGAWVPKT
jgi:hypothetical protein